MKAERHRVVPLPLPRQTRMRPEQLLDKHHSANLALQSGLLPHLSSQRLFESFTTLNDPARQNPVAFWHSRIIRRKAPVLDKQRMAILNTQGADSQVDRLSRRMIHKQFTLQ
jgi:hypothetical protein